MAVWSREFPLDTITAWKPYALPANKPSPFFCQGHLRFCSASATVPVPQIIMHDKYFTKVKTIPVPRTVPVPVPPPPQKVHQKTFQRAVEVGSKK